MLSLEDRSKKVFEEAYAVLCRKLSGGAVVVQNEASLQLQLASILKTLGELSVFKPDERFSIELEKSVTNGEALFAKSGSRRAKIDIWYQFEDRSSGEKVRTAIELKFFKRENHREPDNRYDVYKDLLNLEGYGQHSDLGFLAVFTDHQHYVSQELYSEDTKDFDFRDGSTYRTPTELFYRTSKPYGPPIVLQGDYDFKWDHRGGGLYALKTAVRPLKRRVFV
ncbi:MAG: hypothetical protein JKY51_06580 [Opitutaceae bacterium]|nr:hypothetical protein [Opitutaceae bacterium]